MAKPQRKSRTGGFVGRGIGGRKRKSSTSKAVDQAPKPLAAVPDSVPVPEGRRQPTETEARSRADYTALEAQFQARLAELLERWKPVRKAQVASLFAQIAVTKKLSKLAKISAPHTAGVAPLRAALREAATEAFAGAIFEAKLQGVDLDLETALKNVVGLFKDLDDRALALSLIIANGLSDSARRRAIALTGGTLTKTQVAEQVENHLNSLSDRYLKDQFTGAVVTAQNSGRILAMQVVSGQVPAAHYYISALLDPATCRRCRADDGKRYNSLAAIMRKMPAGGNKDCLGGVRCRCAPIAVYSEAKPSK